MMKTARQSVQNVLARLGWTLVRSEQLSLLREAQVLLPDVGTTGIDYVPEKKIGNFGFRLNWERQLLFLKKLADPSYQEFFRELRSDPDINLGLMGRNYGAEGLIHNGYFPTPDAELYGAIIAEYRPTRIIEIGSGYSTVIAHRAIRYFGIACEIHVIDPEPRRDVSNYASEIEHTPVQQSSLSNSTLSDNGRTIVFIDSSHVTKLGGDVPFLFCQILPNLPVGVLVHVHDIFTPFDYPYNYGYQFYTEQYVLQALLANSSKFSVLFSAHAMSRAYASEMQATFGPRVGKDPLFFGASFWMDTVS
jgi:hypothetical protein